MLLTKVNFRLKIHRDTAKWLITPILYKKTCDKILLFRCLCLFYYPDINNL